MTVLMPGNVALILKVTQGYQYLVGEEQESHYDEQDLAPFQRTGYARSLKRTLIPWIDGLVITGRG